jgi:hypothetical protein
VNNKKYHRLKYAPPFGGNIKILMYFEADTFRHAVTEYEFIGDGSGVIRSGGKAEVHRMVEMFSEFKKAGNLTLPMRYSISRADGDFRLFLIPGMGRGLPYESQQAESIVEKGSTSLSYLINFSDVYFNETLDPAVFKIAKKK